MVALLIGFMPSVLLNSKVAWGETFLLIIPWLIVLLYLKVMDKSISNCKKWIYSSLLAVLQVYAYMVHTRGLVISIAIIIKVKNWKEYSHEELAIILFSLLFFGGSLVMGTLFFFDDLYVSAGMEIIRRGDKIIYTRYLAPASVCMSFVGLYYSLVKKGFQIKDKLVYSGTLFYYCMFFCR